MKAFMSIKHYPGEQSKAKIDSLTSALSKVGIKNYVLIRDYEQYDHVQVDKSTLMQKAFSEMEKCDILIVEFSEKGVGLGIGAGYAYKLGLPIYVIAKTGSDISTSMSSIATDIIFYDTDEELPEKFKKIVE